MSDGFTHVFVPKITFFYVESVTLDDTHYVSKGHVKFVAGEQILGCVESDDGREYVRYTLLHPSLGTLKYEFQGEFCAKNIVNCNISITPIQCTSTR